MAQGTVVARDTFATAVLTSFRARAVAAHPDGGVVTAFDAAVGFGSQGQLGLRRLDANGDGLWTTVRPFPGDPSNQSVGVADAVVTEHGSTVVHFASARASTLVSFDGNGDLEWEIGLEATLPGTDYLVSSIGTGAGSDVFVAGLEATTPINGNIGLTVSLRRLSGATGAELWRYDAPAPGLAVSAANPVLSAFADDVSYIVYGDAASGITAEAIDGSGAPLYTATDLQPNLTNLVGGFIEVSESGRLAFGHWRAQVSQDSHIVVLSPTGATEWRTLLSATWTVEDATFTETGALVVMEGGALGRTLTRFDAAGAVAWQRFGPNTARTFAGVIAGENDGVVLSFTSFAAAFPNEAAELLVLDATGATVSRTALSPSPAGPGGLYTGPTEPVRDVRGDHWVGAGLSVPSVIQPVAGGTVKVVLGGDPSAAGCAPTTPNSTGALSRLRTAGSAVVADNRLTLVADQLPTQVSVLFLNARSAGFTPSPGGSQGDLCLGGPINRYARPGELRTADDEGRAALLLDLALTPSGASLVPIAPGETWHFQAWHRDNVGGVQTSNLTGSLTVAFQ